MVSLNRDYLSWHYNDVIMSAMASQVTGVSSVCSSVCSGADQGKHQSSASLALFEGNPLVTDGFPSQRASNAENVSIWWRHHITTTTGCRTIIDFFTTYFSKTRFETVVYTRLVSFGNQKCLYNKKFGWSKLHSTYIHGSYALPRCRHRMETVSALLVLCAGNPPVIGEFPSQRPVTWSFDVFFDLRFNKLLIKSILRWFETPLRWL